VDDVRPADARDGIRHISPLERDGVTKVIMPIYRDSKMGVMTLRGEAEIAALKAQTSR
jgi:hypothetical protein